VLHSKYVVFLKVIVWSMTTCRMWHVISRVLLVMAYSFNGLCRFKLEVKYEDVPVSNFSAIRVPVNQ
jgi:hypothetical protein